MKSIKPDFLNDQGNKNKTFGLRGWAADLTKGKTQENKRTKIKNACCGRKQQTLRKESLKGRKGFPHRARGEKAL